MSTKRHAESVECLNSSLALAAGDLWPKKGRPITAIKGLSRMQLRHINVHINNRSKGYFQICNNIVQFLFCFGALVFWHYVLCPEETKAMQ